MQNAAKQLFNALIIMELPSKSQIETAPERRFSKEEIEEAKEAFERLARRLDELWQKDSLTEKEEREVELILNNALVISDILEGKTPEEFKEKK